MSINFSPLCISDWDEMRTALLVVVAVLLIGHVQTQEWPTLKHDDQHTGFADSLLPDEGEIAWISHVDGALSSLAIQDYSIFVGTDKGTLHAISVFNGKELWRFGTKGKVSPPTISNERVYFGAGDNLYCLNATTGEKIWSYATGDIIRSSPVVTNDAVYIASDDDIHALEVANGKLIWKKNFGNEITASPALDNEILFFGTSEGTVYAIRAGDGSVVWSKILDNCGTLSSPTVGGGRIYVGCSNGLMCSLDETTGDELWTFKAGGRIESSPSYAGGIVCFGSYDSSIYTLYSENGALKWSYATDGQIKSSPAISNDGIIATSQDGYIYVLNAESGEVIWKHQIGATGNSSPAIAYEKIFIGTSDGELYCFGSWGSLPGETSWKGVVYLAVALILFFCVWWLDRKPGSVAAKKSGGVAEIRTRVTGSRSRQDRPGYPTTPRKFDVIGKKL